MTLKRMRWFDHELGRWLTRDPAGYVDGMSLYQYVQSNPLVYVDPFGLWGIRDLFAGAAAGIAHGAARSANWVSSQLGGSDIVDPGIASTVAGAAACAAIRTIDEDVSPVIRSALDNHSSPAKYLVATPSELMDEIDHTAGRVGGLIENGHAPADAIFGELSGAHALSEAALGSDMVTGAQLTDAERVARGVDGGISLVSLGASALPGGMATRPGVRRTAGVAGDAVRELAESAAKRGPQWTQDVKTRTAPGRDGGTSTHIIERMDGEVNSVTHQVSRDGKIVHQHQTHIGKYGTERLFPDEWVQYPRVQE